MSKEMYIIVLIACVIMVFAAFTQDDAQEFDQGTYCDMVALWQSDKAAGVPVPERAGWPPFRGMGQCRAPQ